MDLVLCAGDLVCCDAAECSDRHAARTGHPRGDGQLRPRRSLGSADGVAQAVKPAHGTVEAGCAALDTASDQSGVQASPARAAVCGGLCVDGVSIHMVHAGPDHLDDWYTPDVPDDLPISAPVCART
ncbi:MAG: hypothetical protein R2856_08350 [Caldilineaceae bacterium]